MQYLGKGDNLERYIMQLAKDADIVSLNIY